jgi:hypothetical protein
VEKRGIPIPIVPRRIKHRRPGWTPEGDGAA